MSSVIAAGRFGELLQKTSTIIAVIRAALWQPARRQLEQRVIAVEVRGHFLVGNGWKIEGKKAIVAHGGCRSC